MIDFSKNLRIVLKVLLFFMFSIRLLGFMMYQSFYTGIENIVNMSFLFVLVILVFVPDRAIDKRLYYLIVLSGLTIDGILIKSTIEMKQSFLFLSVVGVIIVFLFITFLVINYKENGGYE